MSLEQGVSVMEATAETQITISSSAPTRTQELWRLHGLLTSDSFPDPGLNSMSALIEYAANTYRDQTAFYYPISPEPDAPFNSISWLQFYQVKNAVAAQYSHSLQGIVLEANKTGVQPTVALLGHGDTIQFYITEVALLELNIRVLLLAANNNAEAMQRLLKICNASVLIIEESFRLPFDAPNISQLEMIQHDRLDIPYAATRKETIFRFDDGQDPGNRAAFVIHSSGTTGPQKAITHTHRSILTMSRMYRLYPDFHIENWFLLFPLYGVTAPICILPSAFPYGLVTTFPPLSYPPSPSSIFATLSTFSKTPHPIDCMHSTPNHVEALYNYLATTTQDFTPLSSLKVVQPGGAPLSAHVTEGLFNAGVNLKQIYGSSELCMLMRTYPHNSSYRSLDPLRLVVSDDPRLMMDPVPGSSDGERIFELIVKNGYPSAALLWGPDSYLKLGYDEPYRTNDLFREVGEKGSGDYGFLGRRDDIIFAKNGLNISASGIENVIKAQDGRIKGVVLIGGQGKGGLVLLVEVSEELSVQDGKGDVVWEVVRKVNEGLKEWERVERERVYVLGKGETLPVTIKGNVKRGEAEKMFSRVIEGLNFKK